MIEGENFKGELFVSGAEKQSKKVDGWSQNEADKNKFSDLGKNPPENQNRVDNRMPNGPDKGSGSATAQLPEEENDKISGQEQVRQPDGNIIYRPSGAANNENLSNQI